MFSLGAQLAPDYFIDDAIDFFAGRQGTNNFKDAKKSTRQKSSDGGGSGGGVTAGLFHKISSVMNEEMVSKINAVYQFSLSGDEPGEWVVDLKNGAGSVSKDSSSAPKASCTMKMSSSDFSKMFKGDLNSMQAFMTGKLKIEGDMGQALKLEKLMKTVQKSSKL